MRRAARAAKHPERWRAHIISMCFRRPPRFVGLRLASAGTLPQSMPVSLHIRSGFLRALVAMGLCAMLGACVSVKVPKLPAGDLPAHWRNASPELGAKPDLTGWWKHFGDPQLDALVDAALQGNLDVQQAALKLRAARALEGDRKSTRLNSSH